MPERRRLLILGSTGSIGRQAIDVCERSGELELVGLSAERSWEPLVEQARRHGVERIALADADAAARAAESWTDGQVLAGAEGLVRLVLESGADLVLNSLVGSAGLAPTVATLGEGIDLALANKESLVVGGELVTALAEATGARIVPVDSEHTALHQLIAGEPPGGRPRPHDHRQRRTVPRPHPGRARLGNGRGGARPPDLGDGGQDHDRLGDADEQGARGDGGTPPVRDAVRADLGRRPPAVADPRARAARRRRDARAPRPARHADRDLLRAAPRESVELPIEPLDLAAVGRLEFEPVDLDAFPCLRLAGEAARAGGTAPCVLNAANEIAVYAFLDGGLRFLEIAEVIERTLDSLGSRPVLTFDSLYEADREARELALETVAALH